MSRFLMGFHAANMLLSRYPERVNGVYCSSSRSDARMQKLIDLAKKNGVSCVSRDAEFLFRLVGNSHHQGVVVDVAPFPSCDIEDVLDETDCPVLLVLDGITDPHNFGACLRVADATGVTAVIVPKNRSAGLTSVAVKSSSGASEFVRLISVNNLSRTLKMLYDERGIEVIGTDDEASIDLWSWCPEKSDSGVAVVLGSEGEGIRRLTRERCSRMVRIPMYGCVSSLNVSVASGVILYYVRQRLANK